MDYKTAKISIIIPTLNRAPDLENTLDSILKQTVLPHEIIIIDQSDDNKAEEVIEKIKNSHPNHGVNFKYIRQEEKGSAKARNKGIESAAGDILSFLDDDVVLFIDYYETIIRYFSGHSTVVGINGQIVKDRYLSGWKWQIAKIIERLFLIDNFDAKMTISGFGYPIYDRKIKKPIRAEMLNGSNMNIKKSALGAVRYDGWFTGYSFREDVDFSYRLLKKGELAIISDALLRHNFSKVNRLAFGDLVSMQIRNQYYVSRKFRNNIISRILFHYSLFGFVLLGVFSCSISFDKDKFNKMKAVFKAYWSFLVS